ncbi:TetR family transcriptional regulator [Humibacter ginsenosidimutans]|uniref:TetR/AcrR family transcriptional regulator n=1 Tax=Humibacter ginsenosidimutans TaxID=2599293 RepID=A0A5B8M304_9MICO|nr:TetR family transcriptional regulator [Humibacter ginsenosidimutans]QDZ13980.1 TetR/AcrR family transcriptional regulator [Humibacter ginsenosidimutans]
MIEEILIGRQDASNPGSLRVEPAQERSVARIDALLDAAAVVVDDVGFDRLTTAHVADVSGASIGTVYRYFPDRIALLNALRDRAVLRYRLAAADELERSPRATWQEAIDALASTFATMFRTEPGFRIMRFEDVRGVDEDSPVVDHVHEFAERVAGILVASYGFAQSDELIFRLDIASQMAETLIERAYLREADGDERMLAEAGVVAVAYLERYYG